MVAIAMDFNTDDPVDFEEDEEDVDVALASWSKHPSSSMVSSRVLSSFVEKRVIYSAANLCAMTIYFFLFKTRARAHTAAAREDKSYTRTHTLTLETLFFFAKS